MWLYTPAIKKRQSAKLHSPWKGPFVVVDRISDVTYRIEQPKGNPAGKRQIVHFNQLKLCHAHPAAETDAKEEVDVEPVPQAVAEHRYFPDATDLIYGVDQPILVFDSAQAEDAGAEEHPLADPEPPRLDENRRERRPPAWLRDYVLE